MSLDGEAWVRIPTGSVGVKVTLVNFSGNGTLTPTNQAWRCSGGGSSKLTCVVTSNGRFTLQQGGLVTAQPIVVRFASIPGAAVIIPVG